MKVLRENSLLVLLALIKLPPVLVIYNARSFLNKAADGVLTLLSHVLELDSVTLC